MTRSSALQCGSRRYSLIPLLVSLTIGMFQFAAAQDAQEALRKSDTLIAAQKFAEARDVLVPVLEALPKNDADHRFDVLFKLGFLLDGIDPKSGVAYLEEAVKIRPKHPIAWGNLGWNAYLAGDVNKAVSATLKCLELDKTTNYAWGNLGLYHFVLGDEKKSDECYNNAKHWANGPDDLDGAVADVESLCKEKPGDACSKLLEKVKAIRESLNDRASLLREWSAKNRDLRSLIQKSEFAKAEAMGDSLLKALDSKLGKDHFVCVVTMSSIGVAQQNHGKTAEGEQTLLQAVKRADELRSPNTALYADILGTLASFYMKEENNEKAEETLLRILRSREEMLGAHHMSLINTLNQLANACKKLGKDKESEAYRKRVRDIQDYQFGSLD